MLLRHVWVVKNISKRKLKTYLEDQRGDTEKYLTAFQRGRRHIQSFKSWKIYNVRKRSIAAT